MILRQGLTSSIKRACNKGREIGSRFFIVLGTICALNGNKINALKAMLVISILAYWAFLMYRTGH